MTPYPRWHRITVSSHRGGGNSFWVAVIKHEWFVGAWSGNIYRIGDNVSGFCVAWLTESNNGVRPDFSIRSQDEYKLTAITDAQFDGVVTAS